MRSRLWLAAALVVTIGTGLPLLAQRTAKPEASKPATAPGNDVCLACHGDPDAKAESGRSIAVDEKKFGGSVHGALDMKCVDCHKDLAATQDFPHAKPAAVDCASCHKDAVVSYDTSIHASARRLDHG